MLVAMWRGLAEQRPYDESGNMLSDWLERLEKANLADIDCWSWFTRVPGLISPLPTSPRSRINQGLEDRIDGSNGPRTDLPSNGSNVKCTV